MVIAFARCKDSKSTKVYDIFTSLTIVHTGFGPKDLWGSCVADISDQKAAVLVLV